MGDPFRHLIGNTGDYHSAGAVPDQNDTAQILVLQEIDDVLDMDVETNVGASEMCAFAHVWSWALFSLTAMTRGGRLAGVNRSSRGYRRRTDLTQRGPLARGNRLRPTPIWGIGRAGNSLVYSERFRWVHKTRGPLYGRLRVR